MGFAFRVLGLILLITLMEIVPARAWNLWNLVEDESGSWDDLGGTDEAPETHTTLVDDPVSGVTYRQDARGDFDDENNTSHGFTVLPSNGSFSGNDDDDDDGAGKNGDEESKGFAHQLLQRTMDFLSRLLSPSKSSTGSTNSTEADDLQQSWNASDLCLEEGTLANCSDSLTSDQTFQEGSTDEELQELESDYPLVASTDTPSPEQTSDSSNPRPNWIDASETCLRESVEKSAGNCNWEEQKLEDALLEVFNDTIVRRMAKKCMPGEWCLRKHFSKHMAQATQRYCYLSSCLEEWKDDYCRATNVVWSALDLLCSLTRANTSDNCVISVLKMTHVTITDMIRVAIKPEDEEALCSRNEDKADCTGPCQRIGHNLLCMSANCDNNTAAIEGFVEWQWMFGKNDVVEKCRSNSSDCRLFETHITMTSKEAAMMPHRSYHRLLTILKDNEWSVVVGISLSVLCSLLVICGIFLGLRCSGRRRLRQRLLRQKTMTRDDGGSTRDRIQYTIITTQADDFYDQDSDEMT